MTPAPDSIVKQMKSGNMQQQELESVSYHWELYTDNKLVV